MDPTIKDFETAIAELETIVKKLEEGDLRARSLAAAVRARRASVALLSRATRGGREAHRDSQRTRRGQAGAAGLRRREHGRHRRARSENAPKDCARVSRRPHGRKSRPRSARSCPHRPMLRTSSTPRCATACWLAASGCVRSCAWRAPTPLGASASLAMPAACAIELIHTYSLIHDDLPAMDNDTMRRGRPTLHVVAGEGMAILAGDGLLTEAFHLLAREPRESRPAGRRRKLRVIETVAPRRGRRGHGGRPGDRPRVGDARFEGTAATAFDADRAAIDARTKTGALIRASAVSGAIMGGGSDEQIAAIDARRERVRTGVSDRRRHSRRRRCRGDARKNGRQGRRRRQADLPCALWPGRVTPHGRRMSRSRRGVLFAQAAIDDDRLARDWHMDRQSIESRPTPNFQLPTSKRCVPRFLGSWKLGVGS